MIFYFIFFPWKLNNEKLYIHRHIGCRSEHLFCLSDCDAFKRSGFIFHALYITAPVLSNVWRDMIVKESFVYTLCL